jgi:purine nucleosidase
VIQLILDTDIGSDVDDAFALAYAARHPEIELLGVTTVWGDVNWAAALVLRLLDELGVSEVPVAAGHSVAPRAPAWVGSGEVVVPRSATDPRVDRRHAVELIRDTASFAGGPVWLATVGPASNAADALSRHPALRDRLAGVAMMGGRHLPPGAALGPVAAQYGIDPTSAREHNFSDDVQAAAAVCNSGLNVRVCDFILSYETTLGLDDLPAIRRAPGVGGSLAAMLEEQLRRAGRVSTPMFDPVCLTQALGEQFLTQLPAPMRAEVVDGHIHFRTSGRPTSLRLAGAIDASGFRADLLRVVGATGFAERPRT